MSHLKQNISSTDTKILCKAQYTDKDQHIWKNLYHEQLKHIKSKANLDFLESFYELTLPSDYIPSLQEVSSVLKPKTGWEVIEVDGLINSLDFFTMLMNRQFPSTSYIRQEEEFGISKDPDIFHELFGHVPMLMHEHHNKYIQRFGYLGVEFNQIERSLLQRLYWFTYETGLVKTNGRVTVMGGSILSSIQEIQAAFEAPHKPFSLLEILRTPYRADALQSVYFVLEDFTTLFNILDNKKLLKDAIWQAYNLKEYEPSFEVKGTKYESVGCCALKE